MSAEWHPKAGDRVKLKPHNSWCLPWRKFAEEGRGATVLRYAPGFWTPLLIAFDVKRKGCKPQTLTCEIRDVEYMEPHP